MTEFRFDPPLTLKGNVVVRNLDDDVRFMIGYREARRPALQTSVLYRLEGAAGEVDERHAGYALGRGGRPHHQTWRMRKTSKAPPNEAQLIGSSGPRHNTQHSAISLAALSRKP
jgi:hypothetical protein